MGEQISLFDGSERYRIKKPIRLIELFAGIGAQAKALENISADFEHYKICEFDKYAVQSYNAIHNTNFEPSDITKIHASDLGIADTDKYEYIMTYSFPCTDLSIAGKQAGMAKGSGTRSGLLWEVERLLTECKELPQVLLMENVPQVLNSDFGGWLDFLEKLGYKNYYKILNAKNYGIPQNRERCFMVSLLRDYYYDFPQTTPLQLRLKDMLESEVDEKYYLSEKAISYFTKNNKKQREKGNGFRFGITDGNCISKSITTRAGCRMDDNFIKEPCLMQIGQLGGFEKRGRVYSESGNREAKIIQLAHGFNHGSIFNECPSITTSSWESNNLLAEPIAYDEQNQYLRTDGTVGTITTDGSSPKHNNRVIIPDIENNAIKQNNNIWFIRKLTPKETWRLMGFTDSDFDKAKESGVSNSQLYKQAGNSIVVSVLEAILRNLF